MILNLPKEYYSSVDSVTQNCRQFIFILNFYLMAAIIQWNIRGIQSNLEHLHLLIKKYTPAVLVLQETLASSDKSVSGYNSTVSIPSDNSCRGVSILTHKTILASPVVLDTNLNAVAARISLQKTVTVCSIYLSPSKPVKKEELESLIEQLPRPFLLLGDFNGHSPVWGSDVTSARGLMLEELFSETDVSILNDGSPTHFHSANGSFSCIDLSVCDPSLVLDYEWKVHDDLCGSDHFPIVINPTTVVEESSPGRFKFKQAQWESFSLCVQGALVPEDIFTSDDPVGKFSEVLIKCARKMIPQSSNKPSKPKTPWFSEECKKVNKERKKAQRQVFRSPTLENVRKHQQLRAKARFVFKQSKKTILAQLLFKIELQNFFFKSLEYHPKDQGKKQFQFRCSS